MSLSFAIKFKENNLLVECSPEETVATLKTKLTALTRIPVIQQEISHLANSEKTVLSDNHLPLKLVPILELSLKNLGPQAVWKNVFYVQYFGPLFIMPLLYVLGRKEEYGATQLVCLVMTLIHYIKRELETAFVHVFSRESMPFSRLFINSLHYWGFFALSVGVEIHFFPSHDHFSPAVLAVLFGTWAAFQFLNYKCHVTLSNLRQVKSKTDEYENASKKRGIPFGYGFNSISCANYFWEALGWIIFALISHCYTAWIFTALSTYQMLEWAIKKHKLYRKEFGDAYPKNRKAMFPFLV